MTGDGAVVRLWIWKEGLRRLEIRGVGSDEPLGNELMVREHNAAIRQQAAEIERLTGELRMVDGAFGNPTALSECKTRFDKICKMFREIEASHAAKRASEARNADLLKALERYVGITTKIAASTNGLMSRNAPAAWRRRRGRRQRSPMSVN